MSARYLLVRDGQTPLAGIERLLTRDYAGVDSVVGPDRAAAALAGGETYDLILIAASAEPAAALAFIRGLRARPESEALPLIAAAHPLLPAFTLAALKVGADAVVSARPDPIMFAARLRALRREHGMVEEFRNREETVRRLGIGPEIAEIEAVPLPRRVIALTDTGSLAAPMAAALLEAGFELAIEPMRNIQAAAANDAELTLIDTRAGDPLETAADMRRGRRRGVVAALDANHTLRAVRAVELGLAEPAFRPLDPALVVALLERQAARLAHVARLRRTYERSLDLAVTDSLTGLYNRRYLEACFAGTEGAARPRRIGDAPDMALLFIDIDWFKDINDRYGYAIGDEALRQIAQRLRANIRGSDMAARIGGEEFVVLMPGADRTTAETVAERLRETVAARPVVVVRGEGDAVEAIPVTVSIGVAAATGRTSIAALLSAADEALHAAKRAGRNRVTASVKLPGTPIADAAA